MQVSGFSTDPRDKKKVEEVEICGIWDGEVRADAKRMCRKDRGFGRTAVELKTSVPDFPQVDCQRTTTR